MGRKHTKSKASSSPGQAGAGWEVFQRQLVSDSVLDNRGISQVRRARESPQEVALWMGGGVVGDRRLCPSSQHQPCPLLTYLLYNKLVFLRPEIPSNMMAPMTS